MIIYGTGEKKHQVDQLRKLTCPNCGKNGIVVYLFHKYIHLFWIPTFPIGKRTVAFCEECNAAYQDKSIPESLKIEISGFKNMYAPPLYLFTGFALAFIGVIAIIYLSISPKTYKYPSGKKQAKGKMIDSEMDGKWTYWYENGNVSTIQYYENGIEDSTWTWWNEDGSINKIGNYKNGLPHGKWTFYYPSGQLQAEEIYVNNRLQGNATYWYENGKLSAKGDYQRDLKNEHWTYWYKSGVKSEEGRYSLDKRTGDWQSYYENGKRELHTVCSDSLILFMDYWDTNGVQLVKNGTGEYITYYENGQKASQGKLKEGISIGIWNFWYLDGKLKEIGRYENVIYHVISTWDNEGHAMVTNGNGHCVNRYENGVISAEGYYLNGLMEGEWKFKNEFDTIIQVVSYTSGKANGKTSNYYDSGEKYSEGELLNDKQNGKWTWYFQNGSLESQVNFEDGQKDGEQVFWNESGNIIKKEYYEKGKLLKEELY